MVFWRGQLGEVGWSLAAVAVFLVAAATDKLDGQVARKRNLVTDFGKLADPIADKALIAAGLICLWAKGDLSWIAVVVILTREVVVTVIRLVVVRQRVIAASLGGKLKTILQMAAICLYILARAWPNLSWLAAMAGITMIAAVAITVFTGFEYVFQAWPYLVKRSAAADSQAAAEPAGGPAATVAKTPEADAAASSDFPLKPSGAKSLAKPVALTGGSGIAKVDRASQSPPSGPTDDPRGVTAVKADRPVEGWDDTHPITQPTRAVDERGTSVSGRQAPSWSEVERPAAGLPPAPTIVRPNRPAAAAPWSARANAGGKTGAPDPEGPAQPAPAPAQKAQSVPPLVQATRPVPPAGPKLQPTPPPLEPDRPSTTQATASANSVALEELRERGAKLRARLGLPQESGLAQAGGTRTTPPVELTVEERLAALRRRVGIDSPGPEPPNSP